MPAFMVKSELTRQVEHLVTLGYPELIGLTANAFRAALEPLAKQLAENLSERVSPAASDDGSDGHVDFVLVIESPKAAMSRLLTLIERRGLPAVERLYPRVVNDFAPLESVTLPAGGAYLLLDVERGAEYLNVTPDDALEALVGRGRSPLTIGEGVALLTHFPEFLQPNNCFSMLASRAGDKRVPALWLSEKRPKLGWCWAGNPHTWLGSASVAGRLGAGIEF